MLTVETSVKIRDKIIKLHSSPFQLKANGNIFQFSQLVRAPKYFAYIHIFGNIARTERQMHEMYNSAANIMYRTSYRFLSRTLQIMSREYKQFDNVARFFIF
jgi:hypothetical protein